MVHDDDVDRCQHIFELSSQTPGFTRRILNVRLDDKDVEQGDVNGWL